MHPSPGAADSGPGAAIIDLQLYEVFPPERFTALAFLFREM